MHPYLDKVINKMSDEGLIKAYVGTYYLIHNTECNKYKELDLVTLEAQVQELQKRGYEIIEVKTVFVIKRKQ